VVRDVLDALEYLHTRFRYVHRDIKGDNILLDRAQRRGYLSDFGLAAALGSGGTTSAVLATYQYMAPECVQTLKHRVESDLYGVGMVLFEMLNGRIRWEDTNQAKIEKRVSSGQRSLPASALAPAVFAPHVPDRLIRVARKALASNPDRRYRSAAEFMRALNEVATVDWRHVSGEGLDGVWSGQWPPHARVEGRDEYRVSSHVLKAGRDRGKQRLIADYRKVGAIGWRRIGVSDSTIEAGDASAIRQFFSDVAANARQRRPAR
jgi:serine/threonine protein kinase